MLVDFRYIDTSESFEARIDADEMLSDLDSELRENFMPLLERFYNLFEVRGSHQIRCTCALSRVFFAGAKCLWICKV